MKNEKSKIFAMPVIHLEFDDAVVSKEEATAVGGGNSDDCARGDED